jgi:hypothetical protein
MARCDVVIARRGGQRSVGVGGRLSGMGGCGSRGGAGVRSVATQQSCVGNDACGLRGEVLGGRLSGMGGCESREGAGVRRGCATQ